MLISSWSKDESLLYNRQGAEIFRRGIDPAIVKEALARCYKVKPQNVRLKAGNFAEVDFPQGKITLKYYVGTSTERSKVPWYAVEKKYYEQHLLNQVHEILLLFFAYFRENVVTVQYDRFRPEEIPTLWQKPDAQNRYRINYALKDFENRKNTFIKLMDDGTERAMQTVERGISLDKDTTEETS